MKPATDPTKMDGNVAIVVKDATRSSSLSTWVGARFCSRFGNYQATHMESLPSHSISRILVFALCIHNMLFMGALTKIRTQMTNANQSAFEINENGVLMIIAIAALSAVEVTSGILFSTNISSNYYAILKFLCISSASISPFLFLLVLDISPSMLQLLSYAFYGITMAYVSSGNDDIDKDLNKSSPISIFTYLGLVLVPLALVLVLFVPSNLDWIVYSVIHPFIGMEMIYFLIISFKFTMYHEKPKALNLEAHQGIHQEKNKNGFEAQQDKKQSSLTP